MPTYEYACKDCGEHLEVVQSFKDAALTECGRCGGSLRKVFSAAGIIFKGSGYYVNDSRPKPAESGSSDSGSTTTTKSDSASSTSTPSETSTSSTPKKSGESSTSAKSA